MNYKIPNLISSLLFCLLYVINVNAMQSQPPDVSMLEPDYTEYVVHKNYNENCFSGIHDHMSNIFSEWGNITSKIPIERSISKNILKIGIYVISKEDNKWMFIHKKMSFT